MTSLARLLICLAVLPTAVLATPTDDENARLRAQVEQLKAQLEAAKAVCIAAGNPPSATRSDPSTATAASVPAAPPPAPAAKEAAATSAAAVPTAPTATEVPSGYKLVKIEPTIPKDDRWKDRNAWDSLSKGMSKEDVESLLGVEHSVTEGNGRTFWGYGKVGVVYSGKVIFVDDRLAVWTTPDL